MAHSAGACLIMDVLSAGDQKNGFPKGCHLFEGDGRQAGTTVLPLPKDLQVLALRVRSAHLSEKLECTEVYSYS